MKSTEHFRVEPIVLLVDALGETRVQDTDAIPLCIELARCGVRHAAAFVQSKGQLAQVLHRFSKLTRSRPNGVPLVPTIHIGSHGNEGGIRFPSAESITWLELRDLLVQFARDAERMSPRGLALIDLCMSSCRGLHAARMFESGQPFPCVGIIGTHEDLYSYDAVRAFVSSYSDASIRDLQVPERVQRMNDLVGSELFEHAIVPDIQSLLSPGGKSRAVEYETSDANAASATQ